MIRSPCNKCQDRWVTESSRCHATCEKYKAWKDKMQEKSSYCSQLRRTGMMVDDILYKKKG